MEEEPERYTNPSLRLSVQLSCMHRDRWGCRKQTKPWGVGKVSLGTHRC